ncbi:map kinase phosphatase [Plasmopara halstedii]|uniref:Map kinase phosphatase n=1 Tax=Plasmopara halstedii TaxID=4781 RepID=A0A0P1AV69_PLAHL|nr:map kinase phosphatase [Plasmopara halstedii]CEG45301.1 map kinase phosphatase [Plasmopara halstedii]|eukprot:XP_024581670.1 map kinase phosphatase [Plasmopara halstedii]
MMSLTTFNAAQSDDLTCNFLGQDVSVAAEDISSRKARDPTDYVAAWIIKNFPNVTEAELKSQFECNELPLITKTTPNQTPWRCEECNSFDAVFNCDDCNLSLCFRCTDAIHIIPSLSTHTVRFYRPSSKTDQKCQTEAAIVSSKTENIPLCTLLSYQTNSRQLIPTGTHVFFRAPECSRWSRELLHGTLASRESSTISQDGTFYHRVLFMRGVETLPNGSFRAVLTLSDWDVKDVDTEMYWPLELGNFLSQLSALRAAVTAEQIARGKYRSEREGRRMNRYQRFKNGDGARNDLANVMTFPSSRTLSEIVNETVAALSDVHFTRQDDAKFYHDLSQGTWDFHTWMETIGCTNSLREEDAKSLETGERCDLQVTRRNSTQEAVLMPWAPMTRIRYFMIAQHDLIFPECVSRQHLQAIVKQMLFVYTGFAWQLWRNHVALHRARQEMQLRDQASRILQAWTRRLAERIREKERQITRNMAIPSAIDALELYRLRQLKAEKLCAIFIWHIDERKRRALQQWRQVSGRCNCLPVPATTWHPSHGMKNMLPRLPRMGARRRTAQDKTMTVENHVVIEDMAAYKLFKANHAGPADTSYWVIRSRVLAGSCPIGPAFQEARRLVSRTDFATTVLLHQISVFVSLMTPNEATRMKKENIGVNYERQVRTRYEALCKDLKSAKKVSKRHVTLAKQALAKFDAVASSVATQDKTSKGYEAETVLVTLEQRAEEAEDLIMAREALVQKLQLAEQQATKTSQELKSLGLMQLEFLSFPIDHDGVPDIDIFMTFFINQVESRLRAGKNLYIFSQHGHGRTGLVSALLLGRIYGITASEALNRAQAVHDCRRPVAPPGLSLCSPSTPIQQFFVRRALAYYMDPIYAQLVLENTSGGFRSTRVQQRGLLAETYMNDDGFMISAIADDSARERELLDLKRLERIAVSEAAEFQRELRKQRHERECKEAEVRDQIAFEVMQDIYDWIESVEGFKVNI